MKERWNKKGLLDIAYILSVGTLLVYFLVLTLSVVSLFATNGDTVVIFGVYLIFSVLATVFNIKMIKAIEYAKNSDTSVTKNISKGERVMMGIFAFVPYVLYVIYENFYIIGGDNNEIN